MPSSAPYPEWSIRLSSLLRRRELTQASLATKLGVSPAMVSRWLKGTHEPTSARYLQLGNLAGEEEGVYFWERAGVDAGKMPASRLQSALLSLKIDLKDFSLVSSKKMSSKVLAAQRSAVIIPLLDIVAYADPMPHGKQTSLSQAEIKDVIMAPLSWCAHPDSMVSLCVAGDSMYPIIPPDAILAVDTAVNDRAQLNEKLAIFSHRNLGFKVARCQRLASTDILVSANYKFPPIDVSDEAKWKPVGEVVWWVSKPVGPAAAV